MTRMFNSFSHKLWPTALFGNRKFDLKFSLTSSESVDKKSDDLLIVNHKFDEEAIVCFVLALAIGVWYFMKKVNNFVLNFIFFISIIII